MSLLGLLVAMVAVSIMVAAINDAFFEEGEPLEKYAQRWAEIKAGKAVETYQKENSYYPYGADSTLDEIYDATYKAEYSAIMTRGS